MGRRNLTRPRPLTQGQSPSPPRSPEIPPMRRPRFRFSVRRLMIAVAIVGAVLGADRITSTRRAEYAKQAEEYERLLGVLSFVREYGFLSCYYGLEKFPRMYNARTAPRHAAWVAYYEGQHRKYERAARYPWWPVAPDPPEPR